MKILIRVIETFDEMFRPAIAQLNQFIPKDNVMQSIKNEGSIYPAKIYHFFIDSSKHSL